MNALQTEESIKAAKQSFSLLIRVIDSLCYIELNPDLLNALSNYMGTLLKTNCVNLVKVFRQRLSERIDECRQSQITRIYVSIFPNSQTKSIFNIRSSLIAKQLSYLDAKLFKKIEVRLWIKCIRTFISSR